MAEHLNRRIKGIKPSATLAVKAKAQELIAQGHTVIDLSTGEPDLDTPQEIKDAALEAMAKGKTKYTDVAGISELRAALAKKLTQENGVSTTPDQVVVTNGGKQALYEALDVILEPGDEVLIPSPYWVSYPQMIELCGGIPVTIPTQAKQGYKVSPELLERMLSPKTKAIFLNSPSNPAGSGYTREEFEALGEVISRHPRGRDIIVISDEVYEKMVFKGFQFVSFAQAAPELAGQTITINSFSKSYSMTGWRVGYATGPKEVIKAMIRHQSQTTSNVCSIAQYAALKALEGGPEFHNLLREQFEKRIDWAMEAFREAPGFSIELKPVGAFYLFVRADELLASKKLINSTQLGELLMTEAQVAVVPGVEFGDDGAFRISVAAGEKTLKDGVRRIVEWAQRFHHEHRE